MYSIISSSPRSPATRRRRIPPIRLHIVIICHYIAVWKQGEKTKGELNNDIFSVILSSLSS